MATLTLSLKKQWFDLIKRGVKLEEYREINEYWATRLVICGNLFKSFDKLVFTLGYPSAGDTDRRLEFKNPKIRVDFGHAEWGARIRQRYYVITWDAPEKKTEEDK